MGTYMTTFAQRRDGQGTRIDLDYKPFEWQNYSMFGFLADVRNYATAPVLSPPRGWPSDFWRERPEVDDQGHARGSKHYDDPFDEHFSKSWFTLEELLAFDYEQSFEYRRRNGTTVPAGEGEPKTVRELLGPYFFADLQRLQALQCERIMVAFT